MERLPAKETSETVVRIGGRQCERTSNDGMLGAMGQGHIDGNQYAYRL